MGLFLNSRFQTEASGVNRLLNSYAERFGTQSETYQSLAADVKSWLPAENTRFKNGVLQISKPVSLQKHGITLDQLMQVREDNPTYGEKKKEYEEDFNQQDEINSIEEYINLMTSLEKNMDEVLGKLYILEKSKDDETSELASEYHQMLMENRPKDYSELFNMIQFVEQNYREYS